MLVGAAGTAPDPEMLFAVPTRDLGTPIAEGAPGDIDAVIFPADRIEFATAFEFKRVKVQAHTFLTRMPGKLGELKKGVRQANGLQRMGFHRIVLAVLVVTDGRERTKFSFIFRGASATILQDVDSAIDLSELHDDVGAFRLEIIQPLDRDITLSGGITGKAHRIGRTRQQSEQLTQALGAYYRSHSGA